MAYYEIKSSESIVKINSANNASYDARWIVKEQSLPRCASYSYYNFYFVDCNDEEICVEWPGATLNKVYITGCAEDYVLRIEIIEDDGTLHTYSLHNDIRYNIGPLTGPRAFQPKYTEWERSNPLKSVTRCFELIETLGFESFDIIFKQQEKIRELERNCERLNLGYDLMYYGLSSVELLEFPEGITSIKPYAFENLHRLKTLILPSSLEEIEEYSLYSYNLENIYIKSPVPPKFNWFAFGENRTIPELLIYVPKGTLEAYQKAWSFGGRPTKQFNFIEYDYDSKTCGEL